MAEHMGHVEEQIKLTCDFFKLVTKLSKSGISYNEALRVVCRISDFASIRKSIKITLVAADHYANEPKG